MDTLTLFQRFGLAIAIGAIVGMERHWRERDEQEGQRTAGLRTFTLAGLLGGTAGLLEQAISGAEAAGGLTVAGIFLVFSLVFAVFQYRESIASENYSVTSVIAAMSTFALGALAVLGSQSLAAAGGVALVSILASREVLHGFMRTLTWNELRSAILFLAMTFIVLPLIPARAIGPFGGISPADIWMLVILLAGISFCGYVAVKAFGTSRGELLAGAVGGLISSTGVTITNSRRAKAGDDPRPLVAGTLAANAVSCAKVTVFCLALAAPIAWRIGPALVTTALVMAGFSLFFFQRSQDTHAGNDARNPFELAAVLKMALLLVAIAFLARAATLWFGDAGLLVVAALSGLADVDAIAVTIAGMQNTIDVELAARALGVAVIANTIAKAAYAAIVGRGAFSGHFLLASSAALAAGLTVFVLTPAFSV